MAHTTARSVVDSMTTFIESVQDEQEETSHNIREILEAIVALGEGPVATSEVLMKGDFEPLAFSELCRAAEAAGLIVITKIDGKEQVSITGDGRKAIEP